MERLRFWVATVVTVMWVVTVMADLLVPTYDPPATVHLLMMAVAAFLFGPALTGKSRRTNGDDQ